MTEQSFDPAFMAEAEKHPVLGPHYFDARQVAERAMSSFEGEHFKPVLDKFLDDFRDKLWSSVEDSLLSDTEMNLQGEMWRMVDHVVRAICGGDQWALQRYVLGDRHDCEKVRKTIAALIPAELQDKRISDLESKVKQLSEDNQSLRQRY